MRESEEREKCLSMIRAWANQFGGWEHAIGAARDAVISGNGSTSKVSALELIMGQIQKKPSSSARANKAFISEPAARALLKLRKPI